MTGPPGEESAVASRPARAAAARREPPPPLEANDALVTGVITACWVVAFVVLLIVRSDIPPGQRWWIWTTVAGTAQGVFALGYVPYLKRSRARKGARRAGAR